MRFHFTSFMIGVGVGASAVVVGRHMRPVAVELARAAYQVTDALGARMAMMQEDFDDMMAEARARARGDDDEERARA
jgi:hypothetical protein